MKRLFLFFSFVIVASITTAKADITVSITEYREANLVVISYEGSLNTSGLSFNITSAPYGGINPEFGNLLFVPDGADIDIARDRFVGRIDFGLNLPSRYDSFHGDFFGIASEGYYIPAGYNSGDRISGAMTFLNRTMLELGIDALNAPFTTTLSTGDLLTINIVNEVAPAYVESLEAQLKASVSKEDILQKRLKKLNRKFRAAKRRQR